MRDSGWMDGWSLTLLHESPLMNVVNANFGRHVAASVSIVVDSDRIE